MAHIFSWRNKKHSVLLRKSFTTRCIMHRSKCPKENVVFHVNYWLNSRCLNWGLLWTIWMEILKNWMNILCKSLWKEMNFTWDRIPCLLILKIWLDTCTWYLNSLFYIYSYISRFFRAAKEAPLARSDEKLSEKKFKSLKGSMMNAAEQSMKIENANGMSSKFFRLSSFGKNH